MLEAGGSVYRCYFSRRNTVYRPLSNEAFVVLVANFEYDRLSREETKVLSEGGESGGVVSIVEPIFFRSEIVP